MTEDLTGSDKADIKRMIKKELEGPANRREIDKAIENAVVKHLGSAANREVVVRICKDVMVKLYRELSFSYKPLIDRMKV